MTERLTPQGINTVIVGNNREYFSPIDPHVPDVLKDEFIQSDIDEADMDIMWHGVIKLFFYLKRSTLLLYKISLNYLNIRMLMYIILMIMVLGYQETFFRIVTYMALLQIALDFLLNPKLYHGGILLNIKN